jgi:hypothetical protein
MRGILVLAVVVACWCGSSLGRPPGDPTPGNPVLCNNALTLPGTPGTTLVCDWPIDPPLPPVLGPGESWAVQAGQTGWMPDREPAIFVQTWTGLHALNPKGLNWWWGPRVAAANGVPAPADTPRDEGKIQFDMMGRPIDIVPDLQDSYPGPGNGQVDQVEILEHYLNKFYMEGFRRFIFKLPGGNAFNQDFNINQWQLMPQWKQEFFVGTDPLPDPDPATAFWPQWRADHPDAYFELYTGFPIPLGLCTACYKENGFIGDLDQARSEFVDIGGGEFNWRWVTPCPSVPQAEDYNPWSQRHVSYVVESIQPWIDVGFSGFWMDAASSNGYFASDQRTYGRRRGLLELAFQPYFKNQYVLPPGTTDPQYGRYVRFGGETFPDVFLPGPPAREVVDDCSVAFAGWFGFSTVATTYTLLNNVPIRAFKQAADGWLFDRTRSEMLIAPIELRSLNGTLEPPFSWEEIGEARRRGFVMAQYNCDDMMVCERIKRWYSMGQIRICDFDGDGFVTSTDEVGMHAAVNASLAEQAAGGTPLKVFARGDFNANGQIDEVDRSMWTYWAAHDIDKVLNYGRAKDR